MCPEATSIMTSGPPRSPRRPRAAWDGGVTWHWPRPGAQTKSMPPPASRPRRARRDKQDQLRLSGIEINDAVAMGMSRQVGRTVGVQAAPTILDGNRSRVPDTCPIGGSAAMLHGYPGRWRTYSDLATAEQEAAGRSLLAGVSILLRRTAPGDGRQGTSLGRTGGCDVG
jgi:hypothetical protein